VPATVVHFTRMSTILDSPDLFLIRYHRHFTGVTSWAFARGRTEDGRSSYQVLADIVAQPTPHLVVDVGCGDGLLIELLLERGMAEERVIGIDMSPDELMLARKRPTLHRTALLCERAQELPLDRESVGYVLAHLSFMLMSDIERVVSEIARVLLPGGTFSAIVPAEPRAGDAFELFLELFHDMYESQPTRIPEIGDPRTHSAEGLRSLLNRDTGFGDLEITDLMVHLDGPFDQVWSSLASTRRELYVLLPNGRAALRKQLAEHVTRLARPDGTIPCTMALRQLTCQRLEQC